MRFFSESWVPSPRILNLIGNLSSFIIFINSECVHFNPKHLLYSLFQRGNFLSWYFLFSFLNSVCMWLKTRNTKVILQGFGIKWLFFLFFLNQLLFPSSSSFRAFFQTVRCGFAYMVNEFFNHPVPLSFVILGSIFAVRNESDIIKEAQDIWQFLQQIQAISFKSVISMQGLVRFPVHHIRLFLSETNQVWKLHYHDRESVPSATWR